VVEAIRHTQAAGDWPAAALLLADHSFSLTLDGQAQTIQALVRAFPPGADHPELALVRATVDLVQGRLDEAAAHLAVAETYAETAPPDRQRRLQVAIASLKLRLARRRADLVGVLEQVRFLDSPVTGQPDEDIALGSDLRAVALMHLGTVEVWSLALGDGERCLRERAVLAREIGRPYLEVGCRAELDFASTAGSFAAARRRRLEAIVLAQRHGWDAEPVIAPALVTLAGTMIWMDEFDEGEQWLARAARALHADDGPGIRMRLHLVTGMPHAGRRRHQEALGEFRAAGRLQPQLVSSLALASQVTGWTLATQARAGLPGEARAVLAALDDERASSGEIRNARAVICLAEGDPAGVPWAHCTMFSMARHRSSVTSRSLRRTCSPGSPIASSATSARRTRRLNVPWPPGESDRLVLPFAMTGSRELRLLGSRPHALAQRSPDPGDAVSPARP